MSLAYLVVDSDTLDELEKEVRLLIGSGWLPTGGVATYTEVYTTVVSGSVTSETHFCQAMLAQSEVE